MFCCHSMSARNMNEKSRCNRTKNDYQIRVKFSFRHRRAFTSRTMVRLHTYVRTLVRRKAERSLSVLQLSTRFCHNVELWPLHLSCNGRSQGARQAKSNNETKSKKFFWRYLSVFPVRCHSPATSLWRRRTSPPTRCD